jgi:hypothetical protein
MLFKVAIVLSTMYIYIYIYSMLDVVVFDFKSIRMIHLMLMIITLENYVET